MSATSPEQEPPEPTLSDAQYRAMYEGFYARAGKDLGSVPWAALAPHPALRGWLAGRPAPAPGARALVVGCGLGDDAELVASAGYAVDAFDFSPTAISLARNRFPESAVRYSVADLAALPETWRGAFDLVVEIRTLQSMPSGRRPVAVAAIAATVAPGGTVFVHSFGADEGAAFDGPPWPVTQTQLSGFAGAGLVRDEHRADPLRSGAWSLTATYLRPAAGGRRTA